MPQVYLEKLKVNAKQSLPGGMESSVEDQEQEIWKPIKGYERYYSASISGKIKRTKPAHGTIVGKELKPSKNSAGYLHIALSKNSKAKTLRVHKLVAITFLGKPPKGLEVNHKDGIKTNNHVSNLKYVTRSENVRHALKFGLCKRRMDVKNVLEIRKLFSANVYTRVELSKIYEISRTAINYIITRKSWMYI